nr:MAG TPA: hypothetical protein [Caudoviricetes sp.]
MHNICITNGKYIVRKAEQKLCLLIVCIFTRKEGCL